MSQIFSFKRFGKLVVKQVFENSRLYIISPLALLGLLAIVFGFWFAVGAPRYSEEETYIIFFVGLFISGGVFASMSFNMLATKDKGIYWMSIPATRLEKLACTILFNTVIFTVVYMLIFLLVKTVAVGLISNYITKHPQVSYTTVNPNNEDFWPLMQNFFYGYLAVQSLYLLGSIYFPRFSFIITTVIASACLFGFIYYIVKIQDALGGGWEITSLTKFQGDDGERWIYSISEPVKNTLSFLVKYAWAPIFWVITYFRLKEKEI